MSVDLMSAEAEHTVLGCLINHPESWKLVSGKIVTDDFAWELHRSIWTAIGDLLVAGAPVNPMTVTHRIGKEHWKLVQSISRVALGATKVENFAEIVKDRAVRRRLASIDPHVIAGEASTAAEAIGKVQAQINAITTEAVQSGPRMIRDILDDWRNDLHDRRGKGAVRGMPCGIEPLDLRWSGLCAGQMIVIAGRPGNGKTTIAMNIAQNVAMAGKSVLVFSFEMHEIELTDKLVSSHSGNYLSSIKSADMGQGEWNMLVDSVASLKECRLAIDTGTSRTIDQIVLTARAHSMRHGLDLVIVDYLQQVAGEGKERRLQVDNVSRGLKLMAMEMKIPVIALSQLSRNVESRADKRPIMSDLRESGAIEQDADIVAFAHRPEIVGAGEEWAGIAELITAKSRHTEPGTDLLRCDLARSRFTAYEGAYPSRETRQKDSSKAKPGGFKANQQKSGTWEGYQ